MEEDIAQCENVNDEQNLKKGRHRKKQLYNSILRQMEFYFSDSNLTKDRFLGQLLKENPNIDLEVFLKFNKIRKLTTNIADIQKALKKSTLIGLSEDATKIFRKEPIKLKSNVDECTIYVEQIKVDATHDWLSTIFSEFGQVEYVSLPKYKNNIIKGFAFIEFSTEKEAENALNYFESIGNKIPSNISPEELSSIATFEKNNDFGEIDNSNKKRKFADIEDNNEDEEKKRIKTDCDLDKSEEISETEDSEGKKKKKQKQKKKNYIKELGLLVLSKKEWKVIRNRYLTLQRKKMKEFKQHLRKSRQINQEKNKKPIEEEETPQKLDFTPGVIVKIIFKEPCMDIKKFKAEIKSLSSDIKFVDVPLSSAASEAFIRFNDNKIANEFCSNQDDKGERKLLIGDEEKAYWEKIENDRKTKFQKNTKKQRGRDKLLKKAAKEARKHIKFDD